MRQLEILVTILCQSIFSNLGNVLRQRDTTQCRHIVEHATGNHIILSIPRTIISLNGSYSSAINIPLVVTVATLYNAGIGQIQYLDIGHRTMQVIDIRSVKRSCNG